VHRYRVRREQPTVIRQVEIVEEMYTDPDGRDEAQTLIDEQLLEEWQERWDSSERGRTTYTYFPRISSRLRTRCSCHRTMSLRWSRAIGPLEIDCTTWGWWTILAASVHWVRWRRRNISSTSVRSISLRYKLRERALVEGVVGRPRCISGCGRSVTGISWRTLGGCSDLGQKRNLEHNLVCRTEL